MLKYYRNNIIKIEKNKRGLYKVRRIFRKVPKRDKVFSCQFELPPYLESIYPQLERNFQDLIVFGLLNILEWLNLVNPYVSSLIQQYKQKFDEVLQRRTR